MNSTGNTPAPAQRLLSLDLFRGITMFLLVAESTYLYSALSRFTPEGSLLNGLVLQFHHHPWNGLRFWDLVQPFFMFIVGVAMVFSLEKRWARGDTWNQTFRHIVRRCFILFWFGVILHCGYSRELVWELWNVLTQLSFTILVAFLIYRLPVSRQLAISIGLLFLTEITYRLFPVEGFDQPFVKGHNFGSWMDIALMNTINSGGWVAVNCVPTAAHTIWGVLAGKILISMRNSPEKIRILAIAGLIGLAVGYGMDWTGITPIIKRICTSSFVFASGGWCLLVLSFSYWLVDVRGYKRFVSFFALVGMNPIFIYMFSETAGKQWFNRFIAIFSEGFFGWFGLEGTGVSVVSALVTLALEWYLCYWLFTRKIFIRI
ncbi:acyltransferase family protein [candidate division KSB1 bacterium]